ncbi:hypothetical protein [uncultured Vibrio sp.]|uniref:hypothetical protein n=1 Tax=uncultured Vibrio sp. TaxID=114054 RepID=UPI0025CD900B|nr:hypothetical protein [uncultured Vibrio sp.]
MRMMKSTIAIILAIIPSLLYAGGSHFSVKISDFHQNGESFNLVAKINGKFNYDSSSCDEIKLTGSYDKQRWDDYPKLINGDIHLKSLALLQKAYSDKKVINLGYIGGGFLKTGHCSYKSKGLFHYENGVYSIYGRI